MIDTAFGQAIVGLKVCKASAVEADLSAPDAARTIVQWIRGHIVKPHPHLGRPGPVCPFVPPAVQLDCLWLSVVERPVRDDGDLCNILGELLQLSATFEPTVGAGSNLRTFIVVLPMLSGEGRAEQIDRVHATMKPIVVERGLMLGEFYPESMSPGVHNPEYFSLRSPIPLFVLRHMVPGDLVFLNKPKDSPDRRAHFIRAYLRAMEGELTPERLRDAHVALAAAETELDRDARLASHSAPANE